MVGIVTNNKDPEKLGRVKVKLAGVSDVESFWAPVAGARGEARSAASRCCRWPTSR